MDGTSFDRIAKALARRADRRALVRGLGAAGLGVVALGLGGAAAQAPQSRCRQHCRAQGLTGRDFGQCVSACAQAGGPPQQTCVGEHQLCTPPEPGQEDPCCEGYVCYYDPFGEGGGHQPLHNPGLAPPSGQRPSRRRPPPGRPRETVRTPSPGPPPAPR